MAEACIISVAITGSVPRKRDNPALPVTVAEQTESTHAAYEAGAALVHVRNADESPSSDRRSSPPSRRASGNTARTSSCSSRRAVVAGRWISAARCCT